MAAPLPNDLSRFPGTPAALGAIRFEAVPAEPEHPDAHALDAYWQAKARDGIPARADIDPRDIVPLLPQVLIAEPDGAGWRYRLFGSGAARRIGVDFTAKRTDAIYEHATAAECCRLYRAVARYRRPIHVRGRYLGLGIEHLTIEAVHFPLLGRDGETVWIFGGLFFGR